MVLSVEDMRFSDRERAEMLAYHREHLCAFCTMNEDIIKRLRKRIEELELHHNKTTFHTNCEDCVFYVELQKIMDGES